MHAASDQRCTYMAGLTGACAGLGTFGDLLGHQMFDSELTRRKGCTPVRRSETRTETGVIVVLGERLGGNTVRVAI